jgi:hypothetical protein
VPFCPDTGTSISLIVQKVLQDTFPDVPVQCATVSISLSGISKGPCTDEFVQLPFHLVSTEHDPIPFTAEVHIIDHLSPGILLSTLFLAHQGLDVIWAKDRSQVDALV